MAGERMTTIRLPLQIGTSSLWSVARSSAFFPGLVLVGLGIYTIIELLDWDKLGIGIGGGIAGAGIALVYYAYRHARLALDERPSDVLIDESGLRVQGGPRDGLTLTWAELDPRRCAVEGAIEERMVLWRAFVNIPLIALSVVAEGGLVIDFAEKTPIKRLYVARRGDGERILFAEGELPIEQASLETLIATIRSSRWHDEPVEPAAPAAPAAESPVDDSAMSKRKKKKKKKQQAQAQATPKPKPEAPRPILCANCGASVAPAAQPSVTCVFCNHSVPIPDDVRERVAAAANLAHSRRSGFSRLTRLLESQPSAAHAMTAITLAAIPIALAWPVAAVLAVRAFEPTFVGFEHLFELMMFPILLTFAAFLLARARMTDRFALHAVVVGFGAREPARPGDPYRCRACEAALPPAQGTPIVRCVYCHQESVVGLDLRADARAAEAETQSLDDAFRARSHERWLWWLGSVVAVGLLALAWQAIKPSIRKAPLTAADAAFARPQSFDHGAPRFKNIGEHAKLVAMTGTLPFDASTCDVYVAPSGLKALPCRVRFVCDGRDVFGDNAARACVMTDDEPSYLFDKMTVRDVETRVELDLSLRKATLSGKLHDAPFEAKFSFDPSAHAIAQTSATATAVAPTPPATDPPAPFAPIDRTATVLTATGDAPFSVDTCKLHVSYLRPDTCRALLTCGSKRVYGSSSSTTACPTKDGARLLRDLLPTPQDNDPVLIGNLDTGSLELSDAVDGSVYRVTFALAY